MNILASDDLEGRSTGKAGIEKAAVYIENVFKTHNVSPYFTTYKDTLSNFKDGTAYNMIGFVPGNDPALKNEFIVIGAHYDHIGTGEPVNGDTIANGANDNASGTTAVLELAKYFGHARTNKRSLLFVLFSGEEIGLLGSRHLAKKLKAQGLNLYVMVNFEMIGVPMKTSYQAYITGYELSNMASKLNEYSGKEIFGFLPEAKQYQLFKRSDNYPFYLEFKLPCQTISTFDFTNYNYYHHVDDEVSEMDFSHMATVINEMIPALERLAVTSAREITMNE
ncbi:MAG: M20/M25/M40 family metallo-hydrolase [Sinomicrobium sp.]|nr:M20/M25/M40 family metallo-hydrolase [Sinomicrobium sp.]